MGTALLGVGGDRIIVRPGCLTLSRHNPSGTNTPPFRVGSSIKMFNASILSNPPTPVPFLQGQRYFLLAYARSPASDNDDHELSMTTSEGWRQYKQKANPKKPMVMVASPTSEGRHI